MTDSSIERAIGNLEGTVHGLEARIEASAREQKEGHQTLKKAIDDIAAKLGDVTGLAQQVAEMKPEVESYTRLRKLGLGIVLGLSTGGGLFGGKLKDMFEGLIR